MEYLLNIKQKEIVETYSKRKWYGGDDNDFSGFLWTIVVDVYSVDTRLAYDLWMHSPMLEKKPLFEKFCQFAEQAINQDKEEKESIKRLHLVVD